MLDSGQLQRYIEEFSITGLTSNPSIFEKAIKSGAYDDEIRHKAAEAANLETLFFELAIEDLRRAADWFASIHQRTAGSTAGCRWRSRRCSRMTPPAACAPRPTCTPEPGERICSSRSRHRARPAGDRRGDVRRGAGERHAPVLARAVPGQRDAYMRGIERRIEAGLDPNVSSVASVFISRWDAAVVGRVPEQLRARLGLAVGLNTYQAYRQLIESSFGPAAGMLGAGRRWRSGLRPPVWLRRWGAWSPIGHRAMR